MKSQTVGGKFGRDLTTGSIPRHLVMFSIPMLAGNALQAAYGIINAVWVGQRLGKAPLAALVESWFVIFVLMSMAIGLTMGTGILVAQRAGAKDWERVKSVIQNSVVLIGGLCLLLVIVGELFAPHLMRLMGCPADVYPYAVQYLRLVLFTAPIMFGIFLSVAILRGVGDSMTPLYFQTAGLVATAIMDPILMFGWLGFPRMGLNGTAAATIVMQGLALVSMMIYLRRKNHIITSGWRKFQVDRHTIWQIARIGLPASVQQSLLSVGMIFIISYVNPFGEAAAAAYGAATRFDQVAFMPAMTLNVAVSTLVGQNIGAKKVHRVREVFLWGIIVGVGITFVVSMLAVLESRLLMRMFVSDPEVIAVGAHYLRIVGACYVVFAIMLVTNGVINGTGRTMVTTGVSLIALWCGRVPLAWFFTRRLHTGVEGVWCAIAISSVMGMALSLAYYSSGIWKRGLDKKGSEELKLVAVCETMD